MAAGWQTSIHASSCRPGRDATVIQVVLHRRNGHLHATGGPQKCSQAPARQQRSSALHACIHTARRAYSSHRTHCYGSTHFQAGCCHLHFLAWPAYNPQAAAPQTSNRPARTSLRWKMPAASAAAARVFWNTSLKCSGAPAPLLAMTGIVTASARGGRQIRKGRSAEG